MERLEGVPIGDGDLSFLVDIQLESSGRHPVLRSADGGRALGLDIERSLDSTTAHVWLGSEDGWQVGTTSLSGTTGKRLAMRFLVRDGMVLIDELQPWGPPASLRLGLEPGPGLVRNWAGLRVGGASGERPGESFRGRIAEVAMFDRCLDGPDIERIRQASRPAAPGDVPGYAPGVLDEEGRELLLEDYAQLVRWGDAGSLGHAELRAAASLAHVWLLDAYPLLQRASDHFGAMLSLPDLARTEALTGVVLDERPALWWPDDKLPGDWVSLSVFQDDLACWLGQTDYVVSWKQFIKFVRNKLGGGHFDPDERQLWQRQLAELARQTIVGGEPWLAVTMLTLVRSLVIAVEGSGLISLARNAA